MVNGRQRPSIGRGAGAIAPGRTGLHKAQSTLLMVAILVVALNLRPAIAAIGPLTSSIIDATDMGSTGVGL